MFFFKDYWLLGQNSRNLDYIKSNNFTLARKLADSKLQTKEFLKSHHIAAPSTLAIFKKHEHVTTEIVTALEPPFVVKPNNWYGGKGILVIESKNTVGNFVTNSGKIYTIRELKEHFHYIIDGFFAISWVRDTVVIEKKITLTKEIELLGKFGLPDLRVICYNMVPVMAMMRIPTQESWGKANLHGGACGVGIDIGTWKLTYITKGSKIVKSIPWIWDIRGIVLPEWDNILSLAVKVQQVTKIGYLGCDIVLDEDDGPLLLEMNIRAWLEVQVANLAPLKSRLKRVEGIEVNSVEKGVRLGRDLFSGDIEEKIRNISWKNILGTKEYIKVHVDEKSYTYLASIRVSQSSSYIDRKFVENVLKISPEEATKLKFRCEILGVKRTISFLVKDLENINIVLWLSSLKGFLVDPFKYKKGENPILTDEVGKKEKNIAITKTYEKQLSHIDATLSKIEKKLILLKMVTPTNIEEEKLKFIESEGKYVPKFEYAPVQTDIDKLLHDLETIEIPDIPLSVLYIRKKQEVENKIKFIRAFKEQNYSDMTLYSTRIYGDIDTENFDYAKSIIEERDNIIPEKDLLFFDDIKDYLKKFNHIYGIRTRLIEKDATARFTMKGDSLIIRKGASVGKRELRSIVAHEIEWHYLRRVNGKLSKYSIFSRGTAGYVSTEEGIAIYNQTRFISKQDKKYYSIFERYFFVQYARKHSYRRLISKLAEFYNEDYERVFHYMLRLKRGFQDPSKTGIFMKDVVYTNGYLAVRAYLDNGGDLKDLYMWKIGLDDLQDIHDSGMLDIPAWEIKTPFFS